MSTDARNGAVDPRQLPQVELTLVRHTDGPDPRLIALVRLLARRAARQCYQAQSKERGGPRS